MYNKKYSICLNKKTNISIQYLSRQNIVKYIKLNEERQTLLTSKSNKAKGKKKYSFIILWHKCAFGPCSIVLPPIYFIRDSWIKIWSTEVYVSGIYIYNQIHKLLLTNF